MEDLIVYSMSTRDVEVGTETSYGLYQSVKSATIHIADALNLTVADIVWRKRQRHNEEYVATVRAYGMVLDVELNAVRVR